MADDLGERQLVLSLFPGIGLLDMAFEAEGFCVVRGPDLLWGGDVHAFHPPEGRFDGVIGGPPCQAFSRLRHLVQHNGLETAANLIPEYERVVREAAPTWFLMENVPDAPLPVVDGYKVHAQLVSNREDAGGVQERTRRFSFGTVDGRQLVLPFPLPPVQQAWAPAACASGGYKPGIPTDRSARARFLGWKTEAAFRQTCASQGLPEGFDLPPFTVAGKIKAVGNGVPLPMGRAIARAVVLTMTSARAA